VTDELLLVDLDTAAEKLSVSRRFLQNEIYHGRLRSVKAGKRRLVSERSLRDYVELLEQESGAHLRVVPHRRSATG